MHTIQFKVINQAKLSLRWDDSPESTISLTKLRSLCPCATCTTERENQSKTYIPILHSDQIKISKINTVGNYALNLYWADGHNTSIYEYLLLKSFSEYIRV
jgi:DUF971 family protein